MTLDAACPDDAAAACALIAETDPLDAHGIARHWRMVRALAPAAAR